jgi:hypothetical protein
LAFGLRAAASFESATTAATPLLWQSFTTSSLTYSDGPSPDRVVGSCFGGATVFARRRLRFLQIV